MLFFIYDAMRDLVPVAQYNNVKNTYGGGLRLVKLQTLQLSLK